jgi:hypothetical protein
VAKRIFAKILTTDKNVTLLANIGSNNFWLTAVLKRAKEVLGGWSANLTLPD